MPAAAPARSCPSARLRLPERQTLFACLASDHEDDVVPVNSSNEVILASMKVHGGRGGLAIAEAATAQVLRPRLRPRAFGGVNIRPWPQGRLTSILAPEHRPSRTGWPTGCQRDGRPGDGSRWGSGS
jgi:hypothetical protein